MVLGCAAAQARSVVVADSASRVPLPNASVYDRDGRAIATTGRRGVLPPVAERSYPITLRYLGFEDKIVESAPTDTVFLREFAEELPEVVIETRNRRVFHILAYVREYSTMTTLSDTIFLFREKMVDYMLTPGNDTKFRGWSTPRILASRSYYRFTNEAGLDSVSDMGRHHFSWSDWMGIAPEIELPASLKGTSGLFERRGRYSPAETWIKNDDKVSVEVDVMADSLSRRWIPNLEGFFGTGLDFWSFKAKYDYGDVVGETLNPIDLTGYSFSIESQGRGHDMFRFNRVGQSFFVNTNAEVYIIDKEFITEKEARKWADRKFDASTMGIYEPLDAPPLEASVRELVDRVDNLDKDSARLGYTYDHRLLSDIDNSRNFRIGNRALFLLKTITGISAIKAKRNQKKRWDDFKKAQIKKNQGQ